MRRWRKVWAMLAVGAMIWVLPPAMDISPAHAQSSTSIVPGKQLGPVRIGEFLSDVEADLGKPNASWPIRITCPTCQQPVPKLPECRAFIFYSAGIEVRACKEAGNIFKVSYISTLCDSWTEPRHSCDEVRPYAWYRIPDAAKRYEINGVHVGSRAEDVYRLLGTPERAYPGHEADMYYEGLRLAASADGFVFYIGVR